MIEEKKRDAKALRRKNQKEHACMPNSNRSQEDHPSTYFVQNRANRDELTRLNGQDAMLTNGMGGVLSEQPDLSSFQRVLDIGCGTGGWLIEVARTVPTMKQLVGVDVSERLVTYARTQAKAQLTDERVQFQVMDVLRRLDFPDQTFDLVNERLGASYLRTWEWSPFLSAMRRVTRSGGIVRVTEGEIIVESSSPALLQLNNLLVQALYQAGHYFAPDSCGVTNALPRLFEQHGFQQIQRRVYSLEYQGNTPQGHNLSEDTRHLFRTILPFLQKWIRVPENYEDLYQGMLEEMHHPDFTATWRLLTLWGTPSCRNE